MSRKKDSIKKKSGVDVDSIILENRIVFVYEDVSSELALDVNKELIALDVMSPGTPITMMLNTNGGSCEAGVSIMDTIERVKSPVITFINGGVCSMGVHIALAGDVRWATAKSVWMNHDMSDYIWDTVQKLQDRAKFMGRYSKIFSGQMRERTKLTLKEIEKAKNGELWFIGKELLEKGIVDEIV